jgi:excisionase family DNA binding protein
MRREEPDSKQAASDARGGSATRATRKPFARGLTSERADFVRRNPPLVMSAVEAAAYTDTSVRNFRELADRGVFPSIRVGRRVLFRRDAIDAVLVRLETQSSAYTSAKKSGSAVGNH